MKKILSILLAVIFLIGACMTTVSAEGEALSAADYDNMLKTVSFVCRSYYIRESSAHVYDNDIINLAQRVYPERYEDITSIALTEAEIIGLMDKAYHFIADETLNDLFISGFKETHQSALENGIYKIVGNFRSGQYVKDSEIGDYLGYTANDDGTYSFYYSVKPRLYIYDDMFSDEDRKEFDEIPWEHDEKGRSYKEFKGYKFDPGGVDSPAAKGPPEYREFNFSPADGKIKYNYDKWDAELPAEYTVEYVKGDMNGDGTADNKDVVALFRYLSGGEADVLTYFADINEDHYTDNKDIVVLFRMLSEAK